MIPSSPILHKLLLALVALLALGNVVKTFYQAPNHDQPIDFRQLYLAGGQILDGQDPYDDEAIKIRWEEIAIQNNLNSSRIPGFPQNGVVYPLHTLYGFAPLAFIPWPIARIFWWLVVGISFIIAVFLARQTLFPRWYFLQVLVVFLLLKATAPSLLIGQPLWIAFSGLMLVLYSEKNNWPIMMGIGFLLLSLKISLLLPVLTWWALRKKWSNLITHSGIVIIGLVFMMLVSPDFEMRIMHMLDNMHLQWENAYTLPPFNGLAVNLTELGMLAPNLIGPGTGTHLLGLGIFYLLIASGFYFWKKTNPGPHKVHGPEALSYGRRYRQTELLVLALLYGAELLWSYHLIYDAVIFVVLLLAALGTTFWRKVLLFGISIPLILPVNGLLGENPWALHLPVTLLVLFLLSYAYLFENLFKRMQ
ncbi:MAG: hypothetical protein R3B47_13090 [Bacteroidia bacterium]